MEDKETVAKQSRGDEAGAGMNEQKERRRRRRVGKYVHSNFHFYSPELNLPHSFEELKIGLDSGVETSGHTR